MSQKLRILYLLKNYKTLSCRMLAQEYLFHKAASRISELKREGYEILYIPSPTDSPLDAAYTLKSEPLAPVKTVWNEGQLEIAI